MNAFLTRIENTVIVVCMLSAFALGVVQVIGRYVFNTGATWIEPIIVALTILGSLMGASQAIGRNMHVRVGFFVGLLPTAAHRLVDAVAILLALAYALFVGYASTLYLEFLQMIGVVQVDTGLPGWVNGLIVPIAMVFFVVRYALVLPKAWRDELHDRTSHID